MGYSSQFGVVLFHQAFKIVEVYSALGSIARTDQADTQPFLQGKKGDLVGYVVVFSGQDDIALLEGDRAQGLYIGICCAAGECDIAGVGIQQPRNGRVKRGDLRCRQVDGLVAADLRLQFQVFLGEMRGNSGVRPICDPTI